MHFTHLSIFLRIPHASNNLTIILSINLVIKFLHTFNVIFKGQCFILYSWQAYKPSYAVLHSQVANNLSLLT